MTWVQVAGGELALGGLGLVQALALHVALEHLAARFAPVARVLLVLLHGLAVVGGEAAALVRARVTTGHV